MSVPLCCGYACFFGLHYCVCFLCVVTLLLPAQAAVTVRCIPPTHCTLLLSLSHSLYGTITVAFSPSLLLSVSPLWRRCEGRPDRHVPGSPPRVHGWWVGEPPQQAMAKAAVLPWANEGMAEAPGHQ